MTLPGRFWAKVDIREAGECWPWLAGHGGNKNRYGMFYRKPRPIYAHRMAYIFAHGELEAGTRLTHSCKCPLCCNPGHIVIDSPERRFWEKVDIREAGECWPWKSCTEEGYGKTRYQGEQRAHRVAVLISTGSLGKSEQVRHSCDNPPCCNPAHLLKGSNQDNVDDRVARGRGACGEQQGASRMTEKQAIGILSEWEASKKPRGLITQLAKKHGISFGMAYNLLTGRSWKHLR